MSRGCKWPNWPGIILGVVAGLAVLLITGSDEAAVLAGVATFEGYLLIRELFYAFRQ
jgi:hypothetical protein